MSTRCRRKKPALTTRYGHLEKSPETLEKQGFFRSNKFQKLLDKGVMLWYYSQARPSESEGRKSEANLENDTEKKRAIEGNTSEDSRERDIERC